MKFVLKNKNSVQLHQIAENNEEEEIKHIATTLGDFFDKNRCQIINEPFLEVNLYVHEETAKKIIFILHDEVESENRRDMGLIYCKSTNSVYQLYSEYDPNTHRFTSVRIKKTPFSAFESNVIKPLVNRLEKEKSVV